MENLKEVMGKLAENWGKECMESEVENRDTL
jgi:hypothetical protein